MDILNLNAEHLVPVLLTTISILLAGIGYALKIIGRVIITHFKELLDKVELLTDTLSNHKSDMLLLAERVSAHTRRFDDFENFDARIRTVETDIAGIKGRTE